MLADDSSSAEFRTNEGTFSVISCNSSIGIANQADLWETIRYSHVNVYRSTIKSISVPGGENENDSGNRVRVRLADGVCLEKVDLVVHATGYRHVMPIKFEPNFLRLQLGISDYLDSQRGSDNENDNEDAHQTDFQIAKCIQHWQTLDKKADAKIKKTLRDNGCGLEDCDAPSGTGESQVLPYRLFRRMVAPELVAEGDRSFAVLGVILTSTIAVVAEVQALWVTAFLTEGFDDLKSRPLDSLRLNMLSREAMDESISEDVAHGSVTGCGMEVDAIHYNDMLLRDLGLNPYRLGGGKLQELTGVYEPSAYAGIVDEWRKLERIA